MSITRKLTRMNLSAYNRTMKIQRAILLSLTLGLACLPSAFACEFHGGGFGYGGNDYNSDWLAYYEDKKANEGQDERQYSTMSDMIDNDTSEKPAIEQAETQRQSRARPSFSNTATRASDTAKARLGDRNVQTASAQNEVIDRPR